MQCMLNITELNLIIAENAKFVRPTERTGKNIRGPMHMNSLSDLLFKKIHRSLSEFLRLLCQIYIWGFKFSLSSRCNKTIIYSQIID